jgi:hypothetical protein
VTYEPGPQSILQLPVPTADTLTSIANRSTARASSAGGFYGYAVADANDFAPGHPYAQSTIGFYIDAPPVESSTAGSVADLLVLAKADLLQRLSSYQTVQITTWPWPVHECFDIIGFGITGDYDYAAPARFHERRWSLDLFAGTMQHNLSRLT